MKRKEKKSSMKTKKSDYVSTAVGVLLFIAGLVLLKVVPELEGVMRAFPYVCVGVILCFDECGDYTDFNARSRIFVCGSLWYLVSCEIGETDVKVNERAIEKNHLSR